MSEVNVIGAGPAGSAAAIALADIGMNVTLFEKSRFPRAKLCGGFISPEGLRDLERWDVLDDVRRNGATPVRRIIVTSPAGTSAESALSGEGLSISREILDALLLERARRAGVVVREGVDGFTHPNAAHWMVIATGRKRSGEAPGKLAYFGVQTLLDEVPGMSDQVELHLMPEGYVGLVRQGAQTNLCALVRQDFLRDQAVPLDNVLRAWSRQNPRLADRLRAARRTAPWLSVGPVDFGAQPLTGAATLYTGDAAYVVDPFAGEGITMGLRTAGLIQQAFLGHDRVEFAYERLWHAEFDPSLRIGAWTRRAIFRPSLQNIFVGILRRWPNLLRRLADLTRSPLDHEYNKSDSYRRAV